MLNDCRKEIRELAVTTILKAREINLECTDYPEMITWQFLNVTEPPLTKHLPTETLDSNLKDGCPEIGEVKIWKTLLSHTQAKERCVKDVTEPSKTVCGYEKREATIECKIEDRKIRPKFDTKKSSKLRYKI